MAEIRYRFVQDDDSHWYYIPADKKEQFNQWVEWFEDQAGDEPESFDQYRINGYPGNITFTDPQED